jgi:hypothetical protein
MAADFQAEDADWETLLKESTKEMMWFDAQYVWFRLEQQVSLINGAWHLV